MLKLIPLLILFFSCNKFLQYTQSDYGHTINSKGKDHIEILFSHNINGEAYPCGCRNFPLGGLEQINGVIETHRQGGGVIYIDTGDTLFTSTVIPDFVKKSSEFKARALLKALERLRLRIFLPGDQDFALGEEFLTEISKQASFDFLISNASEKMKIKHLKLIHLESEKLNLFFIGVLSPSLLRSNEHGLLTNPVQAIQSQLNIINSEFKEIKNKRIILMSHSGLEQDRVFAKKFPEIDWIIGAHSQSYLRFSEDIGSTQIVQVLSRNHYLGEIKLNLTNKKQDKYQVIEIRDELKDLIKPNPMQKFLVQNKSDLDNILAKEQNFSFEAGDKRIQTYNTCLECHDSQYKFWSTTPHSLAYTTLINAKAEKNPECIQCHSVGLNQSGGFNSYKNILNKEVNQDKYWAELTVKHPLREQSKADLLKWSKTRDEIDQKYKVTQNFAHVQCLNCHDLSNEHPFNEINHVKSNNYKDKCVTCHTRDQSPEWYDKDSKGLATSLNEKYFADKLKKMSCPKSE